MIPINFTKVASAVISLLMITSCSSDEASTENSCDAPTTISTQRITDTSAQISWIQQDAIRFNIEFDLSGFSLGSGNVLNTQETELELSNLEENTSYQYYIQAVCDNSISSAFTGPFSFSTLEMPSCAAPTGLFLVGSDTTFVLISWAPNGENLWEVEFGLEGFTLGNGTLVEANTTQFIVDDLLPATSLSLIHI